MEQQSRAFEHMVLSPTRPVSFLDLPTNIRYRIYEDSGLLVRSKISLGCHNSLAGFTYRILQTCKAVYSEVTAILASENHFEIRRSELDSGLALLRRFSPYLCSQLTTLSVYLYRDEHPDGAQDPPLLDRHISAWQDAISHLLSHVGPPRLNLYLFCDTGDSEKTHAVIKPLLAFPGALKGCALRLHYVKQRKLSRLASDTASRAMGTQRTGSFPFLSLPTELRHAILEYTDLVMPCNHVQWSILKGFERRKLFRLTDLPRGPCCAGFPGEYDLIPPSLCPATSSAYSSGCSCWAAPLSLMLVSRSMCVDAHAVFYSLNRFTIVPYSQTFGSRTFRNPEGALDLTRFINRQVQPNPLQFIRSLDICIPVFMRSYDPSRSNRSFLSWQDAIDQLKTHANISGLTIMIRMNTDMSENTLDESKFNLSDLCNTMPSTNLDSEGSDIPTQEPILRRYVDFIRPMQSLEHLRHFFVYLERAWYLSHNRDSEDDIHRYVRHMESVLEKMVMGDQYDGYTMNKAELEPSYWVRRRQVRHTS
ncbi:hypothetical protein F4677DRAFT_407048 [Hypoxylon crocopeplum]|nr:hypothetical protein F4677DRAFT_407048 [Hypoxylon crocopeplum]